jgi:regulator of chromosome condensation
MFSAETNSFYMNDKGDVFAWGLNNHGQLGIGTKQNTCVPTIIRQLKGAKVVAIAGGEHHSVACTEEGKVYCWGRNDEGFGLGNLFADYKKRLALEEQEKEVERIK